MTKNLKFYTSFEAQKLAEIEAEKKLSMQERLALTVQFIRRIYSKELADFQKPVKRKMNFIKTTVL